MATPMRTATKHSPPAPRRALIVSADIGAGHNSAGRALAEAMARAWPGCQVSWLDALAAIGPGFGALALVQPLLVTGLLFAAGLAAALRRRRHPPDRIMLAGVLCAAAGIASFLAVGRPGGGKQAVGLEAVLPLVTSLAVV